MNDISKRQQIANDPSLDPKNQAFQRIILSQNNAVGGKKLNMNLVKTKFLE